MSIFTFWPSLFAFLFEEPFQSSSHDDALLFLASFFLSVSNSHCPAGARWNLPSPRLKSCQGYLTQTDRIDEHKM